MIDIFIGCVCGLLSRCLCRGVCVRVCVRACVRACVCSLFQVCAFSSVAFVVCFRGVCVVGGGGVRSLFQVCAAV